MVKVDRPTMAQARVAAKFAAYRELFRVRVRDNDPARSGEEAAERTVHWWRRACPGLTRAGYPPVALVVTDAGPTALANRQRAIVDLSADCWRGSCWTVPSHPGRDGRPYPSPTRPGAFPKVRRLRVGCAGASGCGFRVG
ncbi:hypothetical protein [Streptomyces sp. CB01881]|uniref:hypothetical protein n=1 Tax=Streptomyces sp. CB01881 TaxID=2078691 RepID=UPI000CDC4BC1|nr:hypothetical protein [Streptomyces sp. CB01881]AUY53782.1 hypothetical protein C2142_38740 [Streptomyces sp. CB01881]TYC68791.1 hypothetical protein EH183_38730 [Streptomyces sp. CB01881]